MDTKQKTNNAVAIHHVLREKGIKRSEVVGLLVRDDMQSFHNFVISQKHKCTSIQTKTIIHIH